MLVMSYQYVLFPIKHGRFSTTLIETISLFTYLAPLGQAACVAVFGAPASRPKTKGAAWGSPLEPSLSGKVTPPQPLSSLRWVLRLAISFQLKDVIRFVFGILPIFWRIPKRASCDTLPKKNAETAFIAIYHYIVRISPFFTFELLRSFWGLLYSQQARLLQPRNAAFLLNFWCFRPRKTDARRGIAVATPSIGWCQHDPWHVAGPLESQLHQAWQTQFLQSTWHRSHHKQTSSYWMALHDYV